MIMITFSASDPDMEEPTAPRPKLTGKRTGEEAEIFASAINAALVALRYGNEALARKERENILDGLINDDKLIGSVPGRTRASGDTRESVLLNATILLYSGDGAGADEELDKLDLRGDINAIYLKARCNELTGRWNEVGRLYKTMTGMYLSADGDRKSEPRFRKFLYRLAVLNENRFNNPGSGIMRDLALETCDEECFAVLRHMLFSRHEFALTGDSGDLFRLMADESLSYELFLQHLRTVRALDDIAWGCFIKNLKELDLLYPWDTEKSNRDYVKNAINRVMDRDDLIYW